MLNIYRKALNYAHKLDPMFHIDLVHDAYLEWWKKKQENLFECHEGVVIQTIKNVHFSNYTRRTFMWRGNVSERVFTSYNKQDEDQSNPDLIVEYKHNHYNKLTPLDILVGKDLESNLTGTLTEEQLVVYKYATDGYKPSEIAEELNTYRQQVNHKIKAISNKLACLNV